MRSRFCPDCPFRRGSTPGHTGIRGVNALVGQSIGPFRFPCHMTQTDNGPRVERVATAGEEDTPCRGMEEYRGAVLDSNHRAANERLGIKSAEPSEGVFKSHVELVSHHEGLSIQDAQRRLREYTPEMAYLSELNLALKGRRR